MGYRDDVPRRAVAYVAARQAPDGRVLGFLETTWLLAAASCMLDGRNAPPAERALAALAAVADQRWSAASLAGVLNSLGAAGVPRASPLVGRGIRPLVRPDGLWLSEEGEAYHMEVTLAALRALIYHDAVGQARVDLEDTAA
jgi:hypothetical protein